MTVFIWVIGGGRGDSKQHPESVSVDFRIAASSLLYINNFVIPSASEESLIHIYYTLLEIDLKPIIF